MPGFVPNWMGNLSLVNVKDYGALGNGIHDDTTAIQLAFDTAFGTGNIGNQTFDAKPVYFPPGDYMISSPLYIIGVTGARVFGAGNGTSQLHYTGTGTEGNTLTQPTTGFDSSLNNFTPMLALDGVSYSKFEGLSFLAPSANATVSNMHGILIYQSGYKGYCGQNVFENMNIHNMYGGILGYQGGGNCDNCIFNNVLLLACGQYGIKTLGLNVINWQVYGGGAQGCAWLSDYNPDTVFQDTHGGAAAYLCVGGSIGIISGVSCSQNMWDVINAGQQMFVVGGSFEGQQSYTLASATWNSGTGLATITTNVPHGYTGTIAIAVGDVLTHTGYNGSYTGTVTGATTITYPISNPGGSGVIDTGRTSVWKTNAGSISAQGATIHVSGVAYRAGMSVGSRWLDMVFSGQIIATGCIYNPGNDFGFGTIASLGDNGVFVSHGNNYLDKGISCGFKGQNNATMSFTGNQWFPGGYTNVFTNFTGTITEYEQVKKVAVSALPTAAAKFTGLRGSVTDANATTFLTTVASGGSNKVPVFCDGSAWKIG
jgi:hypothetical protein